MIARVRVVTEVEFEAEHETAGEVAETTVLDQVKAEVGGTVIDDLCLVEEVRDA